MPHLPRVFARDAGAALPARWRGAVPAGQHAHEARPDARHCARGALPDHRPVGARRHGLGLLRGAGAARAPRGCQGHPHGDRVPRGHPDAPQALRARGACDRGPEPPDHRGALRLRRGRRGRAPVHGHGAGRRPEPAPSPAVEEAPACRARSRLGRPGAQRAPACARAGRRAPRPEAGKHHGRRHRPPHAPRQALGLRRGQGLR